jgi:hypothetical protein
MIGAWFSGSVLVPVALVQGVPVLVVNVVDVIAVLNRLVAAALPMNMVMLLVDDVGGRRAFVPVPLVGPVSVAVVQVVRVISMGDPYVPAPGSVGMVVVCVGLMFWHETHLLRVPVFNTEATSRLRLSQCAITESLGSSRERR